MPSEADGLTHLVIAKLQAASTDNPLLPPPSEFPIPLFRLFAVILLHTGEKLNAVTDSRNRFVCFLAKYGRSLSICSMGLECFSVGSDGNHCFVMLHVWGVGMESALYNSLFLQWNDITI